MSDVTGDDVTGDVVKSTGVDSSLVVRTVSVLRSTGVNGSENVGRMAEKIGVVSSISVSSEVRDEKSISKLVKRDTVISGVVTGVPVKADV